MVVLSTKGREEARRAPTAAVGASHILRSACLPKRRECGVSAQGMKAAEACGDTPQLSPPDDSLGPIYGTGGGMGDTRWLSPLKWSHASAKSAVF